MQEGITYDKLKVDCILPVQNIHTLSFSVEPDGHAEAVVTGIVSLGEKELRHILSHAIYGESIRIIQKYEEIYEKVIFCGMIQKVEATTEGDLSRVTIRALSSSWLMDIERKRRSFQDVKRTYRQVVEEIVSAYPSGSVVCNVEDRPIGRPLIQYEETDWAFIRRIVSHLHTSVMPDAGLSRVCLYAGLPKGREQGKPEQEPYEWKLQENYDTDVAADGRKPKDRYVCCEMESLEQYRIGDCFTINHREYRVSTMKGEMKGGMMHFTCRLSRGTYFERDAYFNENLKGLSFTGRVLETKGEKLKLHLDMDEKQEKDRAYFYDWKPLTGNMMYCMPEVGTRVGLKMAEADERKAFGMYCVRENGDSCDELVYLDGGHTVNAEEVGFYELPQEDRKWKAPEEKRYFTTAGGKRYHCYPSQMGIRTFEKDNANICLYDRSGITFQSKQKIEIKAEKDIQCSAKWVFISAQKEATLVKKDPLKPTVVNLCNALDAIGDKGNFWKNQKSSEEKKKEEKKKMNIPSEILAEVVPHMIYSIPKEVSEEAAVNKALGSIPLINRI